MSCLSKQASIYRTALGPHLGIFDFGEDEGRHVVGEEGVLVWAGVPADLAMHLLGLPEHVLQQTKRAPIRPSACSHQYTNQRTDFVNHRHSQKCIVPLEPTYQGWRALLLQVYNCPITPPDQSTALPPATSMPQQREQHNVVPRVLYASLMMLNLSLALSNNSPVCLHLRVCFILRDSLSKLPCVDQPGFHRPCSQGSA